jgi:hypothetical protein
VGVAIVGHCALALVMFAAGQAQSRDLVLTDIFFIEQLARVLSRAHASSRVSLSRAGSSPFSGAPTRLVPLVYNAGDHDRRR